MNLLRNVTNEINDDERKQHLQSLEDINKVYNRICTLQEGNVSYIIK